MVFALLRTCSPEGDPSSPHRRAVELVLVRRREDDHHSGRAGHPHQHRDHPPLGMEQLHLR